MILVDTRVWIDFLKNRKTLATDRLLFFLEKEETILYTGLILQELLQGCRKESDCLLIENHFQSFIEIFPQKTTYRLAAKIYRVGILMYGKKPSYKELYKWLRY